jgi:hypothetical protein
MAYHFEYAFPIASGAGKHAYLFANPILFSQIFDGIPQFFQGSTFRVQEILTILSDDIIGDPRARRTDRTWFEDKQYIGTYQLSKSTTLISGMTIGDEGYINYPKIKISRYSDYTITASPDTPIGIANFSQINDCNFRLKEITLNIPPLSVSRIVPDTSQALLSATHSTSRVPLKDKIYNSFFGGVGLYYHEGYSPIGIEHDIAIINTIEADLEPFASVPCSPSEPSCEIAFAQFIAAGPCTVATTQAQLIGPQCPSNSGATEQTWVCPSDPNYTQQYWQAIYGGG